MDGFRNDVAYALRTLLARPLFTVVAALSLAIGVGSTTSMLSVMNVFAFQPVPGVEGWDQAVELGRTTQGRGFDTFTWPDFVDVRERVPALEAAAAWRSTSFSLDTGEGGVRVQGQLVSGDYFDVLGVRPALGRFFEAAPGGQPGREPVAVVSHRFWRERLDGSPDAIGRTIRVNRTPLTVIGVTPPAFGGHMVALTNDLYVPIGMGVAFNEVSEEAFTNRAWSWMQALGRLAPGATVEQADAQVGALFESLAREYPGTNERRSARVIALGPIPGGGRGPALGFFGALTGLVVLVLLVTCANVAGMFLARAASREREIAIRLAVGSGRARLVRQLLTEAVLVFFLGGVGGVLLARWGMGLVDMGALPVPMEISLDLRPDLRILAAGLGVALLTGLLFGLAPAVQAARTDVLSALKADGRAGGGASWLRRVFATAQVGLSLVLLVSAGLFVRSLQQAGAVPRGFEPEGAYATSVDLDLEGYDGETGLAFQDRVRNRVAALPGVQAAAWGIDLPLDLSSNGRGIVPEGWEPQPGERGYIGVDFNRVSPGWFAALGIPVLRGRVFDQGDRDGAPEVAVVSRTLAERLWPDADPVGRRFRYSSTDSVAITVVGVVEDTRNQTLMDELVPFVYRPLAQEYDADVTLVARTERPHAEVAAALRSALLEVDPGISLTPILSVDRITSIGVLPQRIGAAVAGVLGLVALVLAGLGLYGVVAYGVARRTREIGIRMALGAGGLRVTGEVLRGGLALALPGLVAGGALAALVAVLLSRLNVLLGTAPTDPVALIGVAALLAAVVGVASAVPARRASRVEPSEALRAE